jgi:DHA2 family multidrug resistance protein-like MFS transporter
MTASSVSSATTPQHRGDDKLILGIVLAVVIFWLFAQATLNVAPATRDDLQIAESVSNIAVPITALFSGILLSSRAAWQIIGPREADQYRSRPQHLRLAADRPLACRNRNVFDGWVRCPRISADYVMPATLALMKAYFDGKERQRALSFWSIGSWGGFGSELFKS